MKKGLLSLLALALTVVGCQNYDDQFDELTSKITSLQTTVDGLTAVSSSITALQTTVAGLVSTLGTVETTVNGITNYNDSGIVAQLNSVSATLADLLAQLNGVATNADLAAISNTLADVQADVRELLEGESTINQNITISNEATLQYAETLVSTGTDRPNVIVNGNVTVNTTNFSASQVERTNDVVAKIATILGGTSLTFNGLSVTTTHSLDFANLTFIDADYAISGGVDVGDALLRTITGDLTSDQLGAIDYTQLTSVADVEIVVSNKNSITSIDFSNAAVGSLRIGATGVGVDTVDAPKATSVKTGTSSVTTIIANNATEVIHANATGNISTIAITTTAEDARIDVKATKLTSLTITGTATTDLFAISLNGTSTINIGTKIAEAHFTALDAAQGTINATTVDLTDLSRSSGALDIAATTLDLTGFDSTTGGAITTFSGKGAVTLTNMSAATVAAPAITSLTVLNLEGNVTFPNYSKVTTLNVTGKVETAAVPSTQANIVDVSSLASLTTLSADGAFFELTSAGNASLANLTTAGGIVDLTVTGAPKLVSATIGHDHINGNDAATLDFQGTALSALDLSGVSKVKVLTITGNTKLESLTAPSTTVLAEAGATVAITVGVNSMTAAWEGYKPGIPATGTTPAIPAVSAKLKSDGLVSIQTLINAYKNLQTASPTFDIDTFVVSGTTTYADMAALTAVAAPSGTVTGSIDTYPELGLITAE